MFFQHSNQASSNPPTSRYSCRVKIVTQTSKKDSVTRELRRYSGRFTSVPEIKVRIVEQFDDCVLQSRRFSVRYFDPGPAATKRWICCDDNIAALYDSYSLSEESANPPSSKLRKKSNTPCQDQESQVGANC